MPRRPPAPITVEPLLTRRHVMALLSKSSRWVTMHAAELGASRVGPELRFKQADINEYLERRRVRPEPEARPEPTPITPARPVLVHRSARGAVTGREWGRG